jgi:MFS family permease
MMFGLAFGIAGLAGMLGGGWLSDRLSRRGLRWQTWLPAVMYPCSAPFYAAALLAPSANMMIGALSVASLVASAGAGAQFAALMLVVRPGQRATAAAITMFIASAIGMGGAPTLIGVASDLLNPGLGVDSLRWALLGALAVTLVAGGSFFKAGRRLLGDAAAAMPAGPVVEEVRYAT